MGLFIRSIIFLSVLISFPNDTTQYTIYAYQRVNLTAWIEKVRAFPLCVIDHLPLAIFDGTINLYTWNSNSGDANAYIKKVRDSFNVQVYQYVASKQWKNMKELTAEIVKFAQENNELMLKYVEARPDEFTPLFTGVHTNFAAFTYSILHGLNDDCMGWTEIIDIKMELPEPE